MSFSLRSIFRSRRREAPADPGRVPDLVDMVDDIMDTPQFTHLRVVHKFATVPRATSDSNAFVEVSMGPLDREEIFWSAVGGNVEEFEHSPLQGGRRIRLFTLLPSASFDSQVEIRLAEVALASRPDYEALSYAWGDAKKLVGIWAHGRRLDVTVNCALALQNLRHETQPRTLWVDAICINQKDKAECGQQVGIMGDVYKTAQRVLVWLGPRGTLSDVTFAVLKDFEKVAGEDKKKQDAWADAWYRKLQGAFRGCSRFQDDNNSAAVNRDAGMRSQRNLFGGLSERGWFYRLWTLQESVLAREALVVCGKWSISWDVLLSALSRLRPRENAGGRFGFISTFDYALRSRQAVVDALSSPNVSHPVSTVLTQGLLLQAGKPQDHVFGLYALLQKMGVPLSQPDYNRPVEEVFAEAAKLAIERDNALHILTFVNGVEKRKNWPSWVPTWADKLVPLALDDGRFKATKGSSPLYGFSGHGRHLKVQAAKVDIVYLTSKRSPYLGEDLLLQPGDRAAVVESSVDAVEAYHEWMINVSQWPSRYSGANQRMRAFIKVLLQDSSAVFDSAANSSEIQGGFSQWQQLLSAANPGSATPMGVIEHNLGPEDTSTEGLPADKWHLVRTPAWKIHSAIAKDPKASLFDHHVELGCKGKVFFATASGYMGMAPASIREGDAVVLVSGLQTPLVVRLVGGAGGTAAYRLLGPAYVLGMMKGELWRQAGRKLSDMWFV
jgi:hypothetical protein